MRREILGSRHPQTLTSIDELNVLLNRKYEIRVIAGIIAAFYACMFGSFVLIL